MTGDHQDVYAYVCQRIRDGRKLHGLSQHDLAQRLGLHANTISRWETGIYRIDVPELVHLATVFGVSPCWFFPGYDTTDLPMLLREAAQRLEHTRLHESGIAGDV